MASWLRDRVARPRIVGRGSGVGGRGSGVGGRWSGRRGGGEGAERGAGAWIYSSAERRGASPNWVENDDFIEFAWKLSGRAVACKSLLNRCLLKEADASLRTIRRNKA
jgi:hypothetical protein